MVNPTTLESVASAFGRWRKARRSRREPVPDFLQQQALELLAHYKQTQVLQALKINHSMLKRWQEQTTPSNAGFIPVPTDVCEPSEPSSFRVTLSNRHGVQMNIVGAMSTEQLLALASGVLSEQGGIQ